MSQRTLAARVGTLARGAAFVYLVATIVVMASERVYWYWSGFTTESILLLGGFYVIPTAGALWALGHARATHWYHVVLGGAIFGFLVEGVITPVIYSDGPLPIMAAMFVGWHGMLAFFGFWYLTRRWLLERSIGMLSAAAAAVGAMWGLWAASGATQDAAEDITGMGGNPQILTSLEFAAYALAVGLTLAAAHWLIGFVWPRSWQPGRASTIGLAIITVGYMALAVLVSVPWAPLKLGVLVGGTYWLMIRQRGAAVAEARPTIFERLAGRVKLRDLVALAPMPLAAAAVYAVVGVVGLSPDALGAIYWANVAAQVLGGGVAYVVAARRASTRPRRQEIEPARVA